MLKLFKEPPRVSYIDPDSVKEYLGHNRHSLLACVFNNQVRIYICHDGSHFFTSLDFRGYIHSKSTSFEAMMGKNNWGLGESEMYVFDSIVELSDAIKREGWRI